MSRLSIPELGTKLVLAEDWSFGLHKEMRNTTLFELLGLDWRYNWRDYHPKNPPPVAVTLPKGTELVIDRIYIRKGAKEYSSVTFLVPRKKTKKKEVTRTATSIGGPQHGQTFNYTAVERGRPVRFWAKLADVNKIVYEEVANG